ncbi:hypothetical protein AVEN_38055-1 [Araneus ventricosus]|uniref:Sodium-coupled monocarboxylate transporter 1 n=1 Tax=Araneus ventricosus TaxID=182803 RepID=A0A4Y2PDH1_ARAVE|nr:hypothetical protein AVEN_270671-1 [Araneus ventricosus]GBN49109.1 hypothetical protein AVEN_38055-1 [Araneus ventricosus]
MQGIPGLIGLSFAGVFSGSLSTISSALNSLSTVTVVDFLKPLCPFNLNDSKMVVIAKGLCEYITLAPYMMISFIVSDNFGWDYLETYKRDIIGEWSNGCFYTP